MNNLKTTQKNLQSSTFQNTSMASHQDNIYKYDYELSFKEKQRHRTHKNYEMYPKRLKIIYCLVIICFAFLVGLVVGCFMMNKSLHEENAIVSRKQIKSASFRSLNSLKTELPNYFDTNHLDSQIDTTTRTAVTKVEHDKIVIYPKTMTDNMKEILQDTKSPDKIDSVAKLIHSKVKKHDKKVLDDNIYWGDQVEGAIPNGYDQNDLKRWNDYLKQAEVVRIEPGCGRMQNRLATFVDGLQACVRYRQNTDQIQGEIFSYYVARLLNITNLAPSAVKLVDVNDKLWANVAGDIVTSQWNSNRAVVMTQYISSLESAYIPDVFKPVDRHLNKFDVFKLTSQDTQNNLKLIDALSNKVNRQIFEESDIELSDAKLNKLTELAQWTDLIVFDYLTANLDRIANNLFNYQWNINIMDGPAHNLARKRDTGLLVFLDNESGLLHGYRLLKKYNIYHSIMLDNLCVFRKTTITALKTLSENNSIGAEISAIFKEKNDAVIRDVLPGLPEKNVKILKIRIDKVLMQVEKCRQAFS